jgi:predicted metal-dependent hydrolase
MRAERAYVQAPTMSSLRERKPHRFTIGNETLIVRVRESARARTKRIIVGPRRPPEVIVPRGTPDADVDALLEEKRGWVERKVSASREIAARPPQLGIEQPGSVWLAGRGARLV